MAKSVYEMVTDRIINQLEQGVIPWQKPWTGIRSGAYNRVSKKSYSLLILRPLKNVGFLEIKRRLASENEFSSFQAAC